MLLQCAWGLAAVDTCGGSSAVPVVVQTSGARPHSRRGCVSNGAHGNSLQQATKRLECPGLRVRGAVQVSALPPDAGEECNDVQASQNNLVVGGRGSAVPNNGHNSRSPLIRVKRPALSAARGNTEKACEDRLQEMQPRITTQPHNQGTFLTGMWQCVSSGFLPPYCLCSCLSEGKQRTR